MLSKDTKITTSKSDKTSKYVFEIKTEKVRKDEIAYISQASKSVPGPIKGSWQFRLKGRHFGSCLGIFLGIFFSLFSPYFSPKKHKNTLKFLDSSLFSPLQKYKVVLVPSIFLSLILYLGFEV